MIGTEGDPLSGLKAVPRLTLLDERQRLRLHEAALEVLDTVGIRIATAEARSLLVGAGARAVEDDLMTLPRSVVEDALASAPSKFTIYD